MAAGVVYTKMLQNGFTCIFWNLATIAGVMTLLNVHSDFYNKLLGGAVLMKSTDKQVDKHPPGC